MIVFFIFFIGAIFGSFIAVVVERVINQKKFLTNRSICVNCKHTLSYKDLFPVFSYIFLSGKCRYCHKKIPFILFIQEVIAGFTAVLIYFYTVLNYSEYFRYSASMLQLIPDLIVLCFIAGILLLIFFSDLRFMLIPDIYIYLLLIIFALINAISIFFNVWIFKVNILFTTDILNHIYAALLMGLFFYLSYIFTKKKALGEGDIYLAAVLALYLGIKGSVVMWFVSFLTGSLVGVILILIGGKKLGYKIAFGPYLILGFVIALFYGDYILNWYIKFL